MERLMDESTERIMTASLMTMSEIIHQDALEHGLYKPYEKMSYSDVRQMLAQRIIEEAYECYDEADHYDGFAKELADVVIMAFSTAARCGVPIEKAIIGKMNTNHNRPYMHMVNGKHESGDGVV